MRFLNFGLATLVATSYAAPTALKAGAKAPLKARQPPQAGGFPGAQGGFPGGAQGGFPGQGQGGFPSQGQGNFQGQRPGGFQGQGQGNFQGQHQGNFQGQHQGNFQGQGNFHGEHHSNVQVAHANVATPGHVSHHGHGVHGSYSVGPHFQNTWVHIHDYYGNINDTCIRYQQGTMDINETVENIQDSFEDAIEAIEDLVLDLLAVQAGTLDPEDVDTDELVDLIVAIFDELDSATSIALACTNLDLNDLFEDLIASLLAALLQLATAANGVTPDDDDLIGDLIDALTGALDGALGPITDLLNDLLGGLGDILGGIGGLGDTLDGVTGTLDDVLGGLGDITDLLDALGLGGILPRKN